MALYKLFSCNVEVQYKGGFLSKAMLFTFFTTLLNVILPFIIAYRSRGFWLRSESFFEKPLVHFSYDYLVIAETEDLSNPIVCGDIASLDSTVTNGQYCSEFVVQERECEDYNRNCMLSYKLNINIPPEQTISSVLMILGLDFQMKTTCPMHMQSAAVIDREFVIPPSGLKYFADLHFYQTEHLPCEKNIINTRYNNSLFRHKLDSNVNIVDELLLMYFNRELSTQVKEIHSRAVNGHTGTLELDVHIRIPEMKVYYKPSIMQELKWAWPQYLSLVVVFYWLLNRIKRFVFNNRLLMAWEIMPWKK